VINAQQKQASWLAAVAIKKSISWQIAAMHSDEKTAATILPE